MACVQASNPWPRAYGVRAYWVMSYNVRKFIDVMATRVVFLPRWRRRRHGNVDAIGRRGGGRLGNASPIVVRLAVGARRQRSGRGVMAEPRSWRRGRTVTTEWLVHYETAVVTTWRCRCCCEVVVVLVVVANKRCGVVERRTSRAVVAVHVVLVVGCQLVTWLKLVLVTAHHATLHTITTTNARHSRLRRSPTAGCCHLAN